MPAFVLFLSYLQIFENSGSLKTIKVVHTDGTASNTGKDLGLIAQFECLNSSEVQWAICAIHLIELVFRHLFVAIGMWFLTYCLSPALPVQKFSIIFHNFSNCSICNNSTAGFVDVAVSQIGRWWRFLLKLL